MCYVAHAFCIFVLFLLCVFLLSLSFVNLEIHWDQKHQNTLQGADDKLGQTLLKHLK